MKVNDQKYREVNDKSEEYMLKLPTDDTKQLQSYFSSYVKTIKQLKN